MATKTFVQTYDDMDYKAEPQVLTPDAQTYRLIDPATGKTLGIDLGTKNYEKLVKALAPFLAAASPLTSSSSPSKPAGARKAATGSTPDYDRPAFKAWAEAEGVKLSRGRPPRDVVERYLATLK